MRWVEDHSCKMKLIYDLPLEALQDMLKIWGEPEYRATQIWQGMYKHLYETPEQFTNLPLALRRRLEENFKFHSFDPLIHARSRDNETEKVLLKTDDDRQIETVLMYYDKRRTVCISTQAGCAMGCVFCATGQMGFVGNLSRGEIVEQVLYFARKLRTADDRISNIVTMGMGEPFLNYDATMDALNILNHPDGFNFGARRITLSTVGIVPMIERFTQEARNFNLAISLHAATNELRDRLVPINRKYPIEDLLRACNDYVSRTGRRISYEWALIEGVNDDLEQAKKCADLLKGTICHVNLIPLNPTDGYESVGTNQKATLAFRDLLQSQGIPTTVRLRRGIDIHAGCGQLAGRTHH
jgi:23S rRNA (adenine2503-C2)-methyltransferase